MSLKERYGPWALLVGGSEGIGEHLARKLAADGINIILVARKPEALAETAQKVRDESGVEVRTLSLDIGRADLLERIEEVAGDAEIGFLAHNVGGGGGFGLFIDRSLDDVLTSALTNSIALTKLAHRYGKPMADRGRGAILMIGSMAGNAGSYFFTTYAAAKAYNQVLMEGLWAELAPRGVDVLALPVCSADTPSRRRAGVIDGPDAKVSKPEDVAQEALDQLPHGPVYVEASNIDYFNSLYAMPRRQAAEFQRDLLLGMMPS